MEWCLIALTATEVGQTIITFVTVALGLGMVIFVHELGHFAVAKWCGVKCEKFYLGFDIFGKKIFHFTRGETEYGIGVLPLGGYVKMLGQEDNPQRQNEERARALQAPQPGDPNSAEPALDPRSYMAMSVPKRMAIISAGVIMNLIFAIVVFMIAYMAGFPYMPTIIAGVAPGQPAWAIGIEAGDEIVEIGGKKAKSFQNVLEEVMFAGNSELAIKVRRPDPSATEGYRELDFKVKPDEGKQRRLIGVAFPFSLRLASEQPVDKFTPADAVASIKFQGGDEILAINDVAVKTYAEGARELARHASQPVSFKVRQKAIKGEEPKEVTIPVAPRPLKTVGLLLALDKIQAVKLGSRAEKAGLLKDDLLVQMNGEPIGDPLTFPERLRRLHGTEVKLLVQRGKDQKELTITPEDVPAMPDIVNSSIIDVPAIGAAYKVLNRVEKVVAGAPVEKATEGPFEGELISAEIVPDPNDKTAVEAEERTDKLFGLKGTSVFKFGDLSGQIAWPQFSQRIQLAAPGSKVKITLEKGQEATFTPVASTDFFVADRGLNFDLLRAIRKTSDPVEAFQLSVGHALETSGMIYRFLQRLGDWKVSKHAGGPVGIAQVAWGVASSGFIEFLMFLGLLSVNLAVINFLPIPVLDGGHMVFLAYEGIMGKPADERITDFLLKVGLTLLLCLILFVFALDGMRLLEIEL